MTSDHTSRKSLLVGRFAHTRRQLDEILGRLTPDLMDWAPAEGMRTVGGQLAEIAGVEVPLVPFLKSGQVMSYEESDAVVGDPHDFDNLKRALIDVRKETSEYLDSLSEAELLEEVSCSEAWFLSYFPERLPRAEVFMNIAQHELYHVGQLISYLWYRGDDPYKW